MVALWTYQLAFLVKDKHWTSTCILVLALLANITLNLFWYAYYRKKIYSFDAGFLRYQREHCLPSCLLVLCASLASF